MRALKLILSLLPLAYIGWLLFHFTSFDGWSDGLLSGGLGPTVLGLGAIGLLLCIPMLLRLLKLVIAPRGPSPARPGDPPEEPAFDADAALQRYLARKAAGEVDASIPGETPRPVFGRKIG